MKTKSTWLLLATAGVCALGSPASLKAVTNDPSLLPINDTGREIFERATQAVLQGRLLEALRGFDEVLAIDPSNAITYYNRGNVRYLRGEFELAIGDFTSALEYRPGFAAATMNRGAALSNSTASTKPSPISTKPPNSTLQTRKCSSTGSSCT